MNLNRIISLETNQKVKFRQYWCSPEFENTENPIRTTKRQFKNIYRMTFSCQNTWILINFLGKLFIIPQQHWRVYETFELNSSHQKR